MEILEKETKVTIQLDKNDVNTLLYALSNVNDEFGCATVEFWGLGGIRKFKHDNIRRIIDQLAEV